MTKTSPHHSCDVEHVFDMDGWRCSKDRHVLMELFRECRPWRAKDIRKTMSHTAKATVYRNIQLFLETGNIKAISLNGETYYELPSETHHDHEVCAQCGNAYCIDCKIPTIKNHFLQLSFTCSDCKK